jgi:hypothetical protein
VLSRIAAEDWLTGLIDEVLHRLRQRGLSATSAALRCQRVMASRRSEDAVFCKAAGSLGVLAPSDEVEAMRAEKRDVVTIANEFAVSQQVIEHQLANRTRTVAAVAN